MPTINLGKKKQRDKTLSKQRHQDVYQDKRWKRLRDSKKKAKPCCENCESNGVTTATKDVHHSIPFEWGRNEYERDTLKYDFGILQSVCRKCHDKEDRRLRSLSPEIREEMLNDYFNSESYFDIYSVSHT